MPDDDYKFPHELEEENQGKPEDFDIDIDAEGDVTIEIEDDTPEIDRRAKPLDKEVEDPSFSDDSDDVYDVPAFIRNSKKK